MDCGIPRKKGGPDWGQGGSSHGQNHWRPFCAPSVITSDQGSQFVGSWWQTMCGALGIRCAYSQAYHHRANGRAERAGQQIFERLRHEKLDHGLTWVDVLPQILDRIHDTPGEAGLSPYQILLGGKGPLPEFPMNPR